METAQKSKLSFRGFKIDRSLITVDRNVGNEMKILFNASGEINKSEQIFNLILKVEIEDDLKHLHVAVDASSVFEIDGSAVDDPEFSNYLFLNAPAILFPYVRAYVTSLTALSGISPVIIPPINIGGLKERLKKQTQII